MARLTAIPLARTTLAPPDTPSRVYRHGWHSTTPRSATLGPVWHGRAAKVRSVPDQSASSPSSYASGQDETAALPSRPTQTRASWLACTAPSLPGATDGIFGLFPDAGILLLVVVGEDDQIGTDEFLRHHRDDAWLIHSGCLCNLLDERCLIQPHVVEPLRLCDAPILGLPTLGPVRNSDHPLWGGLGRRPGRAPLPLRARLPPSCGLLPSPPHPGPHLAGTNSMVPTSALRYRRSLPSWRSPVLLVWSWCRNTSDSEVPAHSARVPRSVPRVTVAPLSRYEPWPVLQSAWTARLPSRWKASP